MEHPAGAGIEPADAIPAILPDFHRHGFRGQCRATSVLTRLYYTPPISALVRQAGFKPASIGVSSPCSVI